MKIRHTLIPAFVMDVLEEKPCQTDGARPEPHSRYRIVDPEGREDWLCAYDVEVVAP